jgi:uncharacterized radical SAM superfamily protein
MTFDILTDGRAVIAASKSELRTWMSQGFTKRLENFGSTLFCYSPTSYPYRIRDHVQKSPDNFVSISVTGTACALICKHCEGRLLKGMEPALTPDALLKRCQNIATQGGEGVLISGGSDASGHVPLDRFAEVIAHVKRDLDLKVVIHTGLVTPRTAELLGQAGVDAAMLDVIGDVRVAKEVYHLDDGPLRMNDTMKHLREWGVPIVPHLLVGLDYGRVSGELEALEMIAQNSPQALVVIVLSPIRKTPMEHVVPPFPEMVGRVMTVARLGLATTPLLLGCARPIGAHKIESDRYAVECGANGIAYISQKGVELARGVGLNPVFRDVCCGLAYQMVDVKDSV